MRHKKRTLAVLAAAVCVSMVFGGLKLWAQEETTNTINVENDVAEVTGEAADPLSELYAPVYDEETNTTQFSYVYFGSYPQSEVTGEALTEEIVNAEYVSGEAVVGGEKYIRMTAADAYYTVYDRVEERVEEHFKYKNPSEKEKEAYWWETYNDYKDTMYPWDMNGFCYFRYEPIKWKVKKISGSRAVLCSEYALDHRVFEDENIREVTWATSDLHEWLNGVFYETAFLVREKEVMQQVEYRPAGDKVNLASYGLLGDDAAMAAASDYARAMGVRVKKKMGMCCWWTPFMQDLWVCYYNTDGIYHDEKPFLEAQSSYYAIWPEQKGLGVVPSIEVDLSDTSLWAMSPMELDGRWEDEIVVPTPPAVSSNPEESTPPAVSAEPEKPTPPAVSAEPEESQLPIQPEAKKGDVNGDGVVNLDDAQLALRISLKILAEPGEEAVRRADLDSDGKVTLADAQMILKTALKIQ